MRWLALLVAFVACSKSTPRVCTDVASCKAACSATDGAACDHLGKLLLRAQPLDLAGAAAAYKTACDGGFAPSCAALALQVQDGRGVPWDRAQATTLYQRACDGGAGVGCFNLAIMYNEGNGVARDRAKAETLMARAHELYLKQCETDPTWCTNDGYLYESGMVGSGGPDYANAAQADHKACERGDADGCASYAQLQLRGEGVAKDATAATAVLEKLCAENAALACGMLADSMLRDEPMPPRVIELLVKSCDLGNAQSCSKASALHAIGRGVATNPVKASEYGRRACDLGISLACLAEADAIETTKPREAADYFMRACHIGNTEGCDRANAVKLP